jgi:GNAT superfamily N-acetyltransferase
LGQLTLEVQVGINHGVTTYYLEITNPADVRPASSHPISVQVQRAEIPCPALNRFLYATVGRAWHWTDKLPWTDEQWFAYLDRPTLQTWLGYVAGTPVGYFELERQEAGNVEILTFGLLPQFIGQGFGGQLLTAAIIQAWAFGATRIWLHTCSLDGPTALPNYQARGFRVYREETSEPGQGSSKTGDQL